MTFIINSNTRPHRPSPRHFQSRAKAQDFECPQCGRCGPFYMNVYARKGHASLCRVLQVGCACSKSKHREIPRKGQQMRGQINRAKARRAPGGKLRNVKNVASAIMLQGVVIFAFLFLADFIYIGHVDGLHFIASSLLPALDLPSRFRHRSFDLILLFPSVQLSDF